MKELSQQKDFKAISPVKEALTISGSISYSVGQRANNLIRLPKEFLQEYRQLLNRREKYNYKIIIQYSYKKLKEEINKLEKEDSPIPVMMFIGRNN